MFFFSFSKNADNTNNQRHSLSIDEEKKEKKEEKKRKKIKTHEKKNKLFFLLIFQIITKRKILKKLK